MVTRHRAAEFGDLGFAIRHADGYVIQRTHFRGTIQIPVFQRTTRVDGTGHGVIPGAQLRDLMDQVLTDPWAVGGMDWVRRQLPDRLGLMPDRAFVWLNHYDPNQPRADPSVPQFPVGAMVYTYPQYQAAHWVLRRLRLLAMGDLAVRGVEFESGGVTQGRVRAGSNMVVDGSPLPFWPNARAYDRRSLLTPAGEIIHGINADERLGLGAIREPTPFSRSDLGDGIRHHGMLMPGDRLFVTREVIMHGAEPIYTTTDETVPITDIISVRPNPDYPDIPDEPRGVFIEGIWANTHMQRTAMLATREMHWLIQQPELVPVRAAYDHHLRTIVRRRELEIAVLQPTPDNGAAKRKITALENHVAVAEGVVESIKTMMNEETDSECRELHAESMREARTRLSELRARLMRATGELNNRLQMLTQALEDLRNTHNHQIHTWTTNMNEDLRARHGDALETWRRADQQIRDNDAELLALTQNRTPEDAATAAAAVEQARLLHVNRRLNLPRLSPSIETVPSFRDPPAAEQDRAMYTWRPADAWDMLPDAQHATPRVTILPTTPDRLPTTPGGSPSDMGAAYTPAAAAKSTSATAAAAKPTSSAADVSEPTSATAAVSDLTSATAAAADPSESAGEAAAAAAGPRDSVAEAVTEPRDSAAEAADLISSTANVTMEESQTPEIDPERLKELAASLALAAAAHNIIPLQQPMASELASDLERGGIPRSMLTRLSDEQEARISAMEAERRARWPVPGEVQGQIVVDAVIPPRPREAGARMRLQMSESIAEGGGHTSTVAVTEATTSAAAAAGVGAAAAGVATPSAAAAASTPSAAAAASTPSVAASASTPSVAAAASTPSAAAAAVATPRAAAASSGVATEVCR